MDRSKRIGAASALGLAVLGLVITGPVPLGAQEVTGEAQPSVALTLPEPTGPLAIGRVDLHLVDAARPDPWHPDLARALMVTLWYPAETSASGERARYMEGEPARLLAESLLRPIGRDPAVVDFAALETHAVESARPAGGPHPLVLYSPGSGVPRAVGTNLIEDLVSRGYVVAALDHTYEAPAVAFPDGRLVRAERLAGDDVPDTMMQARVADVRFVLDRLAALARGENADAAGRPLPAGLAEAVDLGRVGIFGHSGGGVAALETMGADERVKAAANLDGSVRLSPGAVVDRGLDRPLLLMGTGVNAADGRPRDHLGSPDWSRLWERSTGWKRDIYLTEGRHMAFADHLVLVPQIAAGLNLPPQLAAGVIGSGSPERVLAGQRAYLAAFFELHLKGRDGAFDGLATAHPDFVNVP